MVSAPRAEQAPLRKGRGEGRGALGGLKHGWPWCTALLPRLEEVSHCWRGLGASVTPWNGLEQGQLCPGSSQHSVPVCVPNESLPAAGAVADCAPHVLSISWENKAGCSSTGPWVCGSGESRGDRLEAQLGCALHTGAVAGDGHPSQLPGLPLSPFHTFFFSIQLSMCNSWACSIVRLTPTYTHSHSSKAKPFAWQSRSVLFISRIILLKAQPRVTFPIRTL